MNNKLGAVLNECYDSSKTIQYEIACATQVRIKVCNYNFFD